MDSDVWFLKVHPDGLWDSLTWNMVLVKVNTANLILA
jgi:hypothetical protein